MSAAVAAAAPKKISVLFLCGSIRKASYNRGLLYATLEGLKAANGVVDGITVEPIVVERPVLPLYDEDLDTATDAASAAALKDVVAFQALVKRADAVFIFSPENNFGISPVLANAIAWASKVDHTLPEPKGAQLWANKPLAIASVGGGAGGLRGQLALRQSAVYLNMPTVNIPEVCMHRWGAEAGSFDPATGAMTDPVWRDRLVNLLARLSKLTVQLK
jgi:chromate reductase